MSKEYSKVTMKSEMFKKLDHNVLSIDTVRAMLPHVGQRLLRKPTIHVRDIKEQVKNVPCTVTYVNRDHLWYEVEFDMQPGKKFRECYKLPTSVAPSDWGFAGGVFV